MSEPGGHEGGTGSPLLLVHGVGATWRAWRPVLDRLEPHHHVVVPTLLGHHGAAALAPGVAPSVRALVDGVEAELDRRGLDTVHVAGNSLGGWIAVELARRGRARSVTLFSPAGAWSSAWRMSLVAISLRVAFFLGGLLAGRADRLAHSRVARSLLLCTQVAHPSRVDPDDLADEIRAMRDSPVVRPLLRVIMREPLQTLPRDPAVPVRLVWGARDRVIPFPGYGWPLLERLPGAELVRLPDAGHVPMSDDPARVADLILEVTQPLDAAARGVAG